MIIYSFLNKLLGLDIPPDTYYWMYDITGIIILLLGLVVYLFAWDITFVWLKAWWLKRPVLMEYTGRKYIFKIPKIEKGLDNALRLDDGKKLYELRQESIGLGPHKTQIALCSSEFPATFNPSEVEGQRYYTPQDTFWGIQTKEGVARIEPPTDEDVARYEKITAALANPGTAKLAPNYELEHRDELKKLERKIELWESRKLYARYPDHTLDMNEFVNYQEIVPNPMITAMFGEQRAMETKNQFHNPLAAINIQILIPLIMIIGIVWMMLSNHSVGLEGYEQAMSCTSDYQDLLKECGKAVTENLTYAAPPNTGGAIK